MVFPRTRPCLLVPCKGTYTDQPADKKSIMIPGEARDMARGTPKERVDPRHRTRSGRLSVQPDFPFPSQQAADGASPTNTMVVVGTDTISSRRIELGPKLRVMHILLQTKVRPYCTGRSRV